MVVRTAPLSWLLLLLFDVVAVAGVETFCSTVNTADSSPSTNIYASRGSCTGHCGGSSAYAVVQNDKCWCTNLTPSSTASDGECSKPCPGYPQESCGGDSQFTYVLLDKSKVESSSPSPLPVVSSKQAISNPPPVPATVTVVETSVQDSKTIYKTIEAPTPSSPALGDDMPTFRTVTITPTQSQAQEASGVDSPASSMTAGAATTNESDSNSGKKGLKQEAIIGVAVGASAALLFFGLVGSALWRRRRRRGEDGGAGGDGGDGFAVGGQDKGGLYDSPFEKVTVLGGAGIKRDKTSASADSRMGAFGQNPNLWRNSTGSLQDSSSESNQVLRVVNPDVP